MNKGKQKIKETGPKIYAGGRTKEQILAQRKEMMKPKRLRENLDNSQSSQPNKPNLERPAKGEKLPVDKKEMLKFTKKNYQDLPEVKKRKEEEAKKKQYQERMQKVKENEAKRREMIRNSQY